MGTSQPPRQRAASDGGVASAHWRRVTRALVVAALLAAPACQRRVEPQPIAYGERRCDSCAQVIADRRFAAQFRAGDGALRAFDDPGCLFAALRADPAAGSFFFHDHDAERWISGDDLYLVRIPGSESPRGYGWFALADFSAAQDAVTGAGSGDVLRFAEAREKLP
jgi:hypothetical protein